MRVQSYCLFL